MTTSGKWAALEAAEGKALLDEMLRRRDPAAARTADPQLGELTTTYLYLEVLRRLRALEGAQRELQRLQRLLDEHFKVRV